MSGYRPHADDTRRTRFPLGAAVSFNDLERDPHTAYARLREQEPISWIPALGMYVVTRHDLYRQIMLDDQCFTVGFEHSTVADCMGHHMMTTDGAEARRFKQAHRRPFMPQSIKSQLEPAIRRISSELIDGFASRGEVDLRRQFAARLPVLVMLELFGLPRNLEATFRTWFDALGQGLANTLWDERIRQEAKRAVADFHDCIGRELASVRRQRKPGTLLDTLAHDDAKTRLSDDEIKRNAAIVFFGGISTVEAVVLNTIHALHHHPEALERAVADRSLLPQVIEETIRWIGPVQNSHRHVSRGVEIAGVQFEPGDVVSCSQAAANHDPSVFVNPDRFNIDRPNLQQSVAFAHGPHVCLGLHLARAEARIAVDLLLTRLKGFGLVESRCTPPYGSEFRQPLELWMRWTG